MAKQTKRSANIKRKTNETDISLTLTIEGTGQSAIKTECGFMEHMLTLFARHGCFDLELTCKGDSHVDFHHSVEDMGICLGQAFSEVLGDKRGIYRYGHTILPMDEALILTAVDFSGRSFLGFGLDIKSPRVGNFDTELVQEFFEAFVREAKCSLHVQQLAGINTHHIIEGAFKSFARTLRQACAVDTACADVVPSTKGVL